MSAFTTNGRALTLNFIAGHPVVTPPSLWIKLHKGAPGTDATQNAAVNWQRQQFTLPVSTDGSESNEADVIWLDVSTTETYSYASVWDKKTTGNALYQGQFLLPTSVVVGSTFIILAGDLRVRHV